MTLEECILTNFKFKGLWFMWEKESNTENNIRESLDRRVADSF